MLHTFYFFVLGVLLSILMVTVLVEGWLGQNLKSRAEYILNNKFVLNRSLILFIIFYILIIMQIHFSTISLDSPDKISFSMDGVQIEVAGLYELAKIIGPSAAFLTGVKMGAALVMKSKMGILPKIGTSIASGSIVAGGSYGTIETLQLLRCKMSSDQQATNQISVKIENLNCTVESNIVSSKLQDFLNQTINTNLFTPDINTNKLSPNLIQALSSFKNNFNATNTNLQSKVLEELGKNHGDIASIFANGVEVKSNTESTLNNMTFINSPLEPAQLELLISILNKGLIIQYCMLYLVLTLFFVFTIKLVADRELYTPYWQGKVQSLPLGKYINNLIIRLINIWKVSSILWIYFILGNLLLGICFSTFFVYASLIALQG